jgi:hypothetical protein
VILNLKQIRGLFVSIASVIKYAKRSGQIAATKGTVGRRLDICRTCEKMQGNRCTECGCYLTVKIGLRAVECPIGKWGREE